MKVHGLRGVGGEGKKEVFGGWLRVVFEVGDRELLDRGLRNIRSLRLANSDCNTGNARDDFTLSVSEAKKTAPLPTPSVPFFFFPFLSRICGVAMEKNDARG
jgi:hypothetical protein